MTPERYHQIGQLYHDALERSSAERITFLDQACSGDTDLRQQVQSLLAYDEQAASFIESPPDDLLNCILAHEASRLVAGQTFGHYKIEALIGSGGMGEVYRAADTTLDREVAVKILPEHLAVDHKALSRFEREAKAVAALSHPNILAIYDFGTEQGMSYAVMELLEGKTLRASLQQGALEWRRAAEIGLAVAEGLAATHARGIIHRDLKPENIFLTADGHVKILDFGIAKLKGTVTTESNARDSASSDTTHPGILMGTVGYMSPEQVRAENVETTSDVFSLGCVLYEMTSGRRPFLRETREATITATLQEEPMALSGATKQVPVELERLIRLCLEKRVSDRIQSARDIVANLKILLTSTSNLISSDQPRYPRLRWNRRVTLETVLIGVSLIGLSVGLAYWWKTSLAKPTSTARQFKSIAVLPFKSLTPDDSNKHWELGLADTVITKLSNIQSLLVRPTSAVAKYSDSMQDPFAAGREQKVETVLDGTLQRVGDRVRVSVRLLNVIDGSALTAFQCEEVQCDNIFVMQDVIAQRVAAALTPSVTAEERRKLRKRPTENWEAYENYLKGIFHLNKLTREDVPKAIKFFQEAIYKDPDYAMAYVGLADSYGAMGGWLWCPPKECYPLGKAAALKAISIDGELGEAYATLACVLYFFDWNWKEADKAFSKAIKLSPGYSMGYRAYAAYLITLGRFEEAEAQLQRAWEIEPGSIMNYSTYWDLYYFSRRYDQAIAIMQDMRQWYPDRDNVHYRLAEAYERNGMNDESFDERLFLLANSGAKLEVIDAYKRVYSTSGLRGYWTTYYNLMAVGFSPQGDRKRMQKAEGTLLRSLAYARIGHRDGALYWLEQAYKVRSRGLVNMKVEPLFDEVRNDPLFVRIAGDVGLEP